MDTYSEYQLLSATITLLTFRIGIMRIWHYKRLDRKLRKEKGLPTLEDEDELPDPLLDPGFTHVLTEQQQKDLRLRTWHSYVEAGRFPTDSFDQQSKSASSRVRRGIARMLQIHIG